MLQSVGVLFNVQFILVTLFFITYNLSKCLMQSTEKIIYCKLNIKKIVKSNLNYV